VVLLLYRFITLFVTLNNIVSYLYVHPESRYLYIDFLYDLKNSIVSCQKTGKMYNSGSRYKM